jgi:hydroxypyruvate isomerase
MPSANFFPPIRRTADFVSHRDWHIMRSNLGGHSMNRREFSKSMLAGTLGATSAFLPRAATASPAAASTSRSTASKPVPAAVTPFPLSVMLWTIYRDLPFDQRLEKIAEAGYGAVQLVGEFKKWSDADFAAYNRKKRELEIVFDATSGLDRSLTDPRERDAFLKELDALLITADKLECPAIIVLSGNRVPSLSHEAQHQSCVEALQRAADAAAKRNVTILLENIDPEENPKYFLTSVTEGFEIVGEVNRSNVKFLYDFFHEQISEGNLIEKLEKNIDKVGLVHVADVPGRHEPGTGEINYASIFRKLAALGYKNRAAMEFLPTGDPVASLRAAREYVAAATASAPK